MVIQAQKGWSCNSMPNTKVLSSLSRQSENIFWHFKIAYIGKMCLESDLEFEWELTSEIVHRSDSRGDW